MTRSSCNFIAVSARAARWPVAVLALLGFAFATFSQERVAAPKQAAQAEAVSEDARGVLRFARPSIVQIQGFFGNNTSQAFHGTGFAVGAGGLLLTNYHVVAEQVQYPEKYHLEFRTPEGKSGPVQVLAVDVRHDLAIVRAKDFDAPPLALATDVPDKGVRAYAIGFPLDVGLTITEGVSNGRVADSFDPRIHYSGALNAGMSGGPALTSAGKVLGVNVAGRRFEQLVSFLVPAEHVAALLARVLAQAGAPSDAAQLKRDVTAQLQAHATALLASLVPSAPRADTGEPRANAAATVAGQASTQGAGQKSAPDADKGAIRAQSGDRSAGKNAIPDTRSAVAGSSLQKGALPKDEKALVVPEGNSGGAPKSAAVNTELPVQRIAGYALPGKLADFVDCGAAGDPAPEQPVHLERINCSAKAGLYVQQGLYSGDVRYSHYILTTDRLGALRFAYRLSAAAQASGGYGSRRHVSPFSCRDSNVMLNGFEARLMVCTRGLRNFEGLYDITVRVVSLNQDQRGFASHLDIYGVGFEQGMQLVRRYVGAMRWEG